MNRIIANIVDQSNDGCTIQFKQFGDDDCMSPYEGIRMQAFDAAMLHAQLDEYLKAIGFSLGNDDVEYNKGVHELLSDFKYGDIIYAYETEASYAAIFKIPDEVEDIDYFYSDIIICEEGVWKPSLMSIVCAGDDSDVTFRKATIDEIELYTTLIEAERDRIRNNINKEA